MSNDLQQGALITRDAHAALIELKQMVDSVTEKIRVAERETVGVAIGRRQCDDPLQKVRDAMEKLQSAKFDAAISQARAKMQTAVNWHLNVLKV